VPTTTTADARAVIAPEPIEFISYRTRSLLVPIAWHVAVDLPLYAYLACRSS
jgi:hypothetical protein